MAPKFASAKTPRADALANRGGKRKREEVPDSTELEGKARRGVSDSGESSCALGKCGVCGEIATVQSAQFLSMWKAKAKHKFHVEG